MTEAEIGKYLGDAYNADSLFDTFLKIKKDWRFVVSLEIWEMLHTDMRPMQALGTLGRLLEFQ